MENSKITEKTVKIYANSRPWINDEIKKTIKAKHQAKLTKDKDGLKHLQKILNIQIADAKRQYKNEMLDTMTTNPKKAWSGIKTMMGKNTATNSRVIETSEEENSELAEKLNEFYSRFEDPDRGPVSRTLPESDMSISNDDLFTLDHEQYACITLGVVHMISNKLV